MRCASEEYAAACAAGIMAAEAKLYRAAVSGRLSVLQTHQCSCSSIAPRTGTVPPIWAISSLFMRTWTPAYIKGTQRLPAYR